VGARPYITFAASGAARRDWSWIAIVLTAIALVAATVVVLRRRPGSPTAPERGGGSMALTEDSDERLVAQLAALDDKFAGREATAPAADWQNYQRRRSELKAELERRVARR